jgi:methylenetetrahydrofolate reductase (NADH)
MTPFNEIRNPAVASGALRKSLTENRFAVTAELTPPVSADPADFIARALSLKGIATAVNVTDGAGAKSHLSTAAAAHFLVLNGIEPVLQMTCRDRNRIALQSDLLGAAALGIRNVLILGGDDPKSGDQPDAKPVYDLDARGFLAMAQKMRREGKLLPGTEIKGGFDIFLGAADLPADPPPGWNAKGLKAKAAAGADFIQTQFCMDIGVVRRYAARLVELGVIPKLKILIGIAPIPSARSALWMREKLFGTVIPESIIGRLEKAADPQAEGKRICVELLRQLAEVPGIAGAHVMAPLNPSGIPEVIQDSGVSGKRRV